MSSIAETRSKTNQLKYKVGDHVLYRPLPMQTCLSSGEIKSIHDGPPKKKPTPKEPYTKKGGVRKFNATKSMTNKKPYFGISNDNSKKITFYPLQSIVGHVNEMTVNVDDANDD